MLLPFYSSCNVCTERHTRTDVRDTRVVVPVVVVVVVEISKEDALVVVVVVVVVR